MGPLGSISEDPIARSGCQTDQQRSIREEPIAGSGCEISISEDATARSGYKRDRRSLLEDPTARSGRDMDPPGTVSNDRTSSKKSHRSQNTSTPQKCSVSEQRNAKRVKFRDEADSDLFGKSSIAENLLLCVPPSPPNQPANPWLVSLLPTVGFLPTDIESMFGPAIDTTDDDDFVPPASLLDAVKHVASSTVATPEAPPFRFDMSPASVNFNTALIKTYNYDIEKIITESSSSTIAHGSEFRPLDQLASIYGKHELFPFFANIMVEGMKYKVTEELTEIERVAELDLTMKRGNHKSAASEPEVLRKKVTTDVEYGFAIPIRGSEVPKIPNAMVQPVGIASQFSLLASGARQIKNRLTHDMTYSITKKNASINNRSDKEQYPDMVYGFCLIRTIHYIVALRRDFPLERILISKFDFSDAYRRISLNGQAAVQTILIVQAVAFLCLRLSFGGAVNPATWCSFSEMCCDLSNELPLIPDWDPAELQAPCQKEVKDPTYLPDDVPLAAAKKLAFKIFTTSLGRGDCFIDDIIKVMLDRKENVARHVASAPLAVHVSMRPNAGDREPIPRKDLLNPAKLLAEASPREVQIVLGWLIDARRLLLALPEDKFIVWNQDLVEVLKSSSITREVLESMIGRLTHASYVVPLSRHFLQRFRQRLNVVRDRAPAHIIRLSDEELSDVKLWMHLLQQARQGISLNGIVFRHPTRLTLSDSCPLGLGGFTSEGRAWRLKVNPASRTSSSCQANNVLEFLAMVITVWLSLLELAKLNLEEELILALGDNTSAISWFIKTGNLKPGDLSYKAANFIARKLAELVSSSKNFLASQHVPGDQNNIADWLTFEGKDRQENGTVIVNPVAYDCPSNDQLTQRCRFHFPQLVPPSFKILPLPPEVLSFAQQATRTVELSLIQRENQVRREGNVSGDGGKHSAPTTSHLVTPLLMEYPMTKPTSPLRFSSRYIDTLSSQPSRGRLLDTVVNRWREKLLKRPQGLWRRRSGNVTGGRPFTQRYATSEPSPVVEDPLASSKNSKNSSKP